MLTAKKAVKTVGIMFILVFSAKILGQAREMMLASFYGTSVISSAFQAASQIPLLFFEISLGVAISSTFIPIFNEYYEKQGVKRAYEFSNNFLTIIGVLSFLFVCIGILFAPFIISMVAKGITGEALMLSVSMLKIMFPMVFFTAIAFSIVGILQSMGEFNIPAAMSLVSNLAVILYFIFLNKYFGIIGLCIAVVLGWLLQLIILFPPLLKKGYFYKIRLNFFDEGIKKVGILALPVLISAWVAPINSLINLRLASYLNSGQAIAAISYANKLYLIIASVFTLVLTNYIFPKLSRLFVGNDKIELTNKINASIKAVIIVTLPIMACFLVLSRPIISLIYERGEFTAYSTTLTSGALFFYSFGMLGFGIQEVLNKTFYAIQKSKVPMQASIIGILINILLSIILVRFMGIGGLALASSISLCVISVILAIKIKKEYKDVLNKKQLKQILKFVIGFAFMLAVVTISYKLLYPYFYGKGIINLLILLILPSFFGTVSYVIMLFVFKTEETKILKQMIKR